MAEMLEQWEYYTEYIELLQATQTLEEKYNGTIYYIDGPGVPLDRTNVNTDEITPARFLKTINVQALQCAFCQLALSQRDT